jgi:hypothetical protein
LCYIFIALFENWEQTQGAQTQGFISGELLRHCQNRHAFMAILRFANWEAAHAYKVGRLQDGWYQRLLDLTENVQPDIDHHSEWQMQ